MLSIFRQFLIVIALICLATTGMAETETESGSVSEFMTPDGRIDLEAARQSGFEGSLNLDGFDVTLDPETGEPLLSPAGVNGIESHPDDIYWHDMSVPDIGISGTVYALTVYEGDLIAGGYFSSAGGVICNNVARWDGCAWDSLSSGLGDTVRCLVVLDGVLIAAGDFLYNGKGQQCNYVAKWDGGESWVALGETGVAYPVSSMTLINDDLVVGGYGWIGFYGSSGWYIEGGLNGKVLAIAEYNGRLIIGGDFTSANGVDVNYIARRSNSWPYWVTLGAGMSNPVHALTVYDGELIAGGEFTVAGSVVANRVASWDDTTWQAVGQFGMGNTVTSLTTCNDELFAGGIFEIAGGTTANRIARWDGSAWQALGTGTNNNVHSLIAWNDELILGGEFTIAGSVAANHVARWDGSVLQPLGSGLNSHVRCLTVCDSDLIAGGGFTMAGWVAADHIASWDGSAWDSFDYYLETWNDVSSLTVWNGSLIVGGVFYVESALQFITRWFRDTWEPLDSGTNGPVYSLTDWNGDLIAGGHFNTAGGITANNIASFSFSGSWQPFGSGMNDDVYALTVYDGDLIAGGEFTTAGGATANYVARWDGSNWQPLGDGLTGYVRALTVYNGVLIAGGTFSHGNYVAQWNGSNWTDIGLGVSYYVSSLTVYNGELIAGGEFTTAGLATANKIARWNGLIWQPLGSGMSGMDEQVLSLTVYNGDLIAGGSFTIAGGKSTTFIARWDMPTSDIDGDGYTSAVDCDDTDQYTYPGAAPNDSPTACMRDTDQDDFGDINVTGDIIAGTDCDDTDVSVYPGATEIPDDGIDQDCDGEDLVTSCCGLYTTGQTGNCDCDEDGKRNLADITRLIDRVYVSKLELCCEENGNVDGDELDKTNLADITKLIDHVYVSKEETAACE